MKTWGTKEEKETKKRIQVALWAYAYEIESDPLVSDAEFDKMCESVDLKVDTGNKMMDDWFKENFEAHTGQWVHKHPQMGRLKDLYEDSKHYERIKE